MPSTPNSFKWRHLIEGFLISCFLNEANDSLHGIVNFGMKMFGLLLKEEELDLIGEILEGKEKKLGKQEKHQVLSLSSELWTL